ncbi:MAG: glycosyltransferase family 9 protein, partial [Planctomycetes bacterium]|nr:glycosyltransferase family 9 protein [Planctomycetota bacterium]
MPRRERILLVRLSSGGDILQALPALAALREARPSAHLTFLAEDRHARYLEGRPEIDRLLFWPRREWEGLAASGRWLRCLAGMARFYSTLARERFDAVLDFQGNLKSGFHAWVPRSPRRVGFARGASREANALFSGVRVEPRDERGPRVRKYLDLLSGIGIRDAAARPVPPPAGAAEAFRKAAAGLGLEDGRFLVIHPGVSAFGAYKAWPLPRWRELAALLAPRDPVLVSWGPGEENVAEALSGLAGVRVPRSPLAIPALAGALAAARAFAGSDSAPLHLAHALGCPSVGVFGPTDPRLYGPFMAGSVVRAGLPCSPCKKRSCPGSPCMAAVTVESVLRAVRSLPPGG